MNWQDIVKGLRKGVGAVSRAPDVAGRNLGNLISRSRTAERVVNTIGNRGGSRVASAIQGLTGVRDFREAGQQFERGQNLRALGNVGEGALNLLGTALAGGAARGGYTAARAAGRPVVSSALSAARAGVVRDPLSARLRGAAAGRSPLVRAGAAGAGMLLPGGVGERLAWSAASPVLDRLTAAVRGTPGPSTRGPSTLGMTADMLERRLQGGAPVSTAPRSTGPRGSQFVDPATGFVNTWNPLRQAYEVTGLRPSGSRAGSSTPATTEEVVTGGPMGALPMLPEEGYLDGGLQEYLDAGLGTAAAGGYAGGGMGGGGAGYSTELAALDPEQMEELLQAARDEERRYQEVLNQIGRTTSEKERAFFDLQRGVGREVAGGRQTTSSALAQLGMDTSPATSAYSEYLGATGQRRIAQGRADLAEILADLRQQRGTAEARKLAALREIDKATRRARVQNTMRQAGNYF